MLSYDEQLKELRKAKRVIEGVAGRIESFRAPMLRMNEATVRALEEAGFKTDSSVASQSIEYLFADVIRHKLKLKNLGQTSLKLLDDVITSAKEFGFEFVSAREYMKLYKV